MVTGGTTWMHEVRSVDEDAVSVSRLRSCGVIFVGKANMHEMGMGTTGNNPNYGYGLSVYSRIIFLQVLHTCQDYINLVIDTTTIRL